METRDVRDRGARHAASPARRRARDDSLLLLPRGEAPGPSPVRQRAHGRVRPRGDPATGNRLRRLSRGPARLERPPRNRGTVLGVPHDARVPTDHDGRRPACVHGISAGRCASRGAVRGVPPSGRSPTRGLDAHRGTHADHAAAPRLGASDVHRLPHRSAWRAVHDRRQRLVRRMPYARCIQAGNTVRSRAHRAVSAGRCPPARSLHGLPSSAVRHPGRIAARL